MLRKNHRKTLQSFFLRLSVVISFRIIAKISQYWKVKIMLLLRRVL